MQLDNFSSLSFDESLFPLDLIVAYRFSGGDRGGVTPVPIPNTEVKPSSADGTCSKSYWESR